MPRARSGTRLPPALALFGCLWAGHPFDGAVAERFGRLRRAALDIVGEEARHGRAGAGSTPQKKPMSVPRIQAGHDRRQSARVSRTGPPTERRVSAAPPAAPRARVAAYQNTSPTANRPTVTKMTFTPPSRPAIPNVKRAWAGLHVDADGAEGEADQRRGPIPGRATPATGPRPPSARTPSGRSTRRSEG